MALTAGPADDICSARGCEADARWAVVWSNPALPTRREKTWLACDEHRDYLHSYLAYRSFPVRDVPFEDVRASESH
ncbi:hypothetical protein H8R18_03655 [Nanchangia anserum]|uniref:Acetone carboxylase n=1 Tax=Nanchangia anserum TaxID=2692125 RepID=A0A8I0KMW9_9ACTO|nr:hypothetical protein [Nanchangia anserum]MBD3688656.1 hypothetical protein [Nanchangia anserum]QOX82411.1 hypothetical protein H8R18_03655 [Nanchangia anserum]